MKSFFSFFSTMEFFFSELLKQRESFFISNLINGFFAVEIGWDIKMEILFAVFQVIVFFCCSVES